MYIECMVNLFQRVVQFLDKKELPTVQSIDRALDIIELLSTEHTSLGLTDIANKVGLHKSTVYRIISVLLNRQYLSKDEKNGHYTIGIKLIQVACHRINDLELLTEARPFLWRLQGETNLTVQLGVLDGLDVVYLDEVNGVTMRKFANVGYHSPAYCSSLGKCLLTGLSGEKLDRLMKNFYFVQYTPTTITDMDHLKDTLRTVRKQGWAMNDCEYSPDLRSVASPIFDYNGEVVAAVSAGGHVSCCTDDRLEETASHVQRISLAISRKLGYSS